MLALGVWAFRLYMAERIVAADSSVEGYIQALKWHPKSDEYRAILGIVYRDRKEGRDLDAAVRELDTAVKLRPRVWTHHLALALAYEQRGNLDQAEASLKEALRLNPKFAQLRWQAANFFLRRANTVQAIPEFRAAVELDPSRLSLAANRLLALGVPVDEVGEKMVPPHRPDLLAYLNIVLSQFAAEPEKAVPMAWKTWQRWEQAPASENFNISSTFGYISFLINHAELEKAKRVWEVGLREAGLEDAPGSGAELVFNGGFEKKVLGGGLDWVLANYPGVYYEYDHETRYEGAAALRLNFAGQSNLDFRGPRQTLILPAGNFQLAFVSKSEGITSDQGICLEVYSMPDNKLLVKSQPILGTNDWGRKSCEFVVTEPTAAYLIVHRHPSDKFENTLEGKIWLDSIQIHGQ
jgi:hypothetical protein